MLRIRMLRLKLTEAVALVTSMVAAPLGLDTLRLDRCFFVLFFLEVKSVFYVCACVCVCLGGGVIEKDMVLCCGSTFIHES